MVIFSMDAGVGLTTRKFWLFGGTGNFNNIGGGPVSIIEEIDSSLTLITSKGNLIKLNFNGNVIWSKVIDKGLAKDLKKQENPNTVK